MKKKQLKLLNLNKKSISNLAIHGGAAPPRDTQDTVCSAAPSKPSEPSEPSASEETFARMCATTIITTYCPTALCY